MRIHFIAIGGAAMHNLALTLQRKGHTITGSDDVIYEPSRTRLLEAGILPAEEGWFPEKITPELDAVILGMHARSDNPELARARELNIPIYSYPEFVYHESENKNVHDTACDAFCRYKDRLSGRGVYRRLRPHGRTLRRKPGDSDRRRRIP